MLQKNIPIFIKKMPNMPALSSKIKLLFVTSLSILLFAVSCKKAAETQTTNILQQYFEQNVLNRDFTVARAIDDTVHDNTAQYNSYVFRLEKNTTTNSQTDGPMNAKVNGNIVYTGTWSCTEEYGKLGIQLDQPNTPTEFVFLNRSWKFTEKAFPIMKLAPWGNSACDTLYMERH
jgi:hypothetical protein